MHALKHKTRARTALMTSTSTQTKRKLFLPKKIFPSPPELLLANQFRITERGPPQWPLVSVGTHRAQKSVKLLLMEMQRSIPSTNDWHRAQITKKKKKKRAISRASSFSFSPRVREPMRLARDCTPPTRPISRRRRDLWCEDSHERSPVAEGADIARPRALGILLVVAAMGPRYFRNGTMPRHEVERCPRRTMAQMRHRKAARENGMRRENLVGAEEYGAATTESHREPIDSRFT